MRPDDDARRGAIHDTGYRRYEGARRPASQRFWVIARTMFVMGWRMKWGVKAPVILTALSVLGASTMIIILGHEIVDRFRRMGADVPGADWVLYGSISWFVLPAFLLALSAVASQSAEDFRRGAFQFYFSRPIGPGDYLLGKVVGSVLLVGMSMFLGPTIVALVRLTLARSAGELVSLLPLVGMAMAIGLVGTLGVALPALACGALMQKRRAAQIMYVAIFFLLGVMATVLAHTTDTPWLLLLSLSETIETIARELVGIPVKAGEPQPPVWAAVGGLLAWSFLSLWIVHHRITRTEASGLGESA